MNRFVLTKEYEIPEWLPDEPVMVATKSGFLSMTEDEVETAVNTYTQGNHCPSGVKGEIYKTIVQFLKSVENGTILFGIKSKNGKNWMEVLLHTPDNMIHLIFVSSDGRDYSLYLPQRERSQR